MTKIWGLVLAWSHQAKLAEFTWIPRVSYSKLAEISRNSRGLSGGMGLRCILPSCTLQCIACFVVYIHGLHHHSLKTNWSMQYGPFHSCFTFRNGKLCKSIPLQQIMQMLMNVDVYVRSYCNWSGPWAIIQVSSPSGPQWKSKVLGWTMKCVFKCFTKAAMREIKWNIWPTQTKSTFLSLFDQFWFFSKQTNNHFLWNVMSKTSCTICTIRKMDHSHANCRRWVLIQCAKAQGRSTCGCNGWADSLSNPVRAYRKFAPRKEQWASCVFYRDFKI